MAKDQNEREKHKNKPDNAPSYTTNRLPSKAVEALKDLVHPHVESFNYFLGQGLEEAINSLPPLDIEGTGESSSPRLQIWVESVTVGYPYLTDSDVRGSNVLRPRICRERGMMYDATMMATICAKLAGGPHYRFQARLGNLPVMVGSDRCHLRGASPGQLAAMGEEATELGGYFIVNGIERVIRLLQVPRRNYATAITRSAFKNRGPQYSDKGVAMRCVRPDQSSQTVTCHYLTNGTANLKFVVKKQEFLVPALVVLKALGPLSDREVYEHLLRGDEKDTFLAARAELLLRDAKRWGCRTPAACRAFLGARFRAVLPLPASAADEAVGSALLERHILVHLPRFADKQAALLHMLRKLYAFARGRVAEDNADALSNQELLLPGQLICMYLKEKIWEMLENVKANILRDARKDHIKVMADLQNDRYLRKLVERYGTSVGGKIASLLSTGNIVSSTGLDLMQVSGYTIVAEKLNWLRYLSHFRSVHRGQFFTTMKTTAVRKLLPDSWGFLCPVHTPDGSPCGLLNHLAAKARAVCRPPPPPAEPLDKVLASLGVALGGGGGGGGAVPPADHLDVLSEGRVLGSVAPGRAAAVAAALRALKVAGGGRVAATLEVALVPPARPGGRPLPFPGLYLFHGPGRLARPVRQLATGRTEQVGPLEQVFMDIACLPEDIREGVTTHQELDPTNMLSLIASLTPFSDYNQSPRNMYQCQMGKQTMGTPAHSILPHRTDNKLYRILTPQAPIVQTARHSAYQMDEYPQGTNAVVAVISYTGYDMEDAMILNRAAFDRGFAHAAVYKTKTYDLLAERGGSAKRGHVRFANRAPGDKEGGAKIEPSLGEDGLPHVGAWVKPGDPLLCHVDDLSGEKTVVKHKDTETAVVQDVRLLGAEGGLPQADLTRVSLTLRYPRNPIIGDKFSSRHGQKGVLSILWPQENMPFTESGMTPDVIINPHAFPSRMTIGMLIESMAGKAGAMHGHYQDATPFTFHEQRRAVDHFGEQLRAAGYAYHGSEPLYSGVSGTVMHADIFIGLVYYQRLRHMVSDKSQVRATGPVNPLTRQPVKGRKRHGGIRFGEMERDALLSHGAAFLLHDRLMNCSDRHPALVCSKCGSVLSTVTTRKSILTAGQSESLAQMSDRGTVGYCRFCESSDHCHVISLPYVFRYLANELAGMNIKINLKLDV